MSDESLPLNPKADIYISYTSQDQALLDELLKHLTSLQWSHIILSPYHEEQISSTTPREEIELRINSADVVVMLVSSAYLDSVERRRWELQEITTKALVIAINLSPVNLADSSVKEFCSPVLSYSPVTSWEAQIENLKIAAKDIHEAASLLGSKSNVLDDQSNVELDNDLASDVSSSRGVERSIEVPPAPNPFPFDMVILKTSQFVKQTQESQLSGTEYSEQFFKEQLEQLYRIQQPPSQPTVTNKDLVDCSVFSPPVVPCGETFFVQVFAHLPEQAEIAQQNALQFDPDTKQLGVKSLGVPIERGTELTFNLSIPKLEVDDPIQQLIWNGRAQSVQFGVTVPLDLTQKTVIGTITISHNSIPVGHLKFKLSITSAASSTNREPQLIGEDARLYRKAFVSYSSKDRQEVLKRVQGLAATGIEVFQDVLNLEPGDRWEKELYRHINECDLFLLFWSTSAKESQWVLKEALYALERQGKDGLHPPAIIPVIIEGPPPVSPPDELQHLHFNDKLLYLMAMSGRE
ncbi:MAG TPA: toll/interleukin-1 receptor domain-containing protein [Cyanobacteria bacterium UBA8553]|nr:toll/interleukin-1 receptor domain-containing protein [Cyanobacteria bacterium UBA8553]HAJ62991.1 toll/interleukin-1 receptor domain-containing protein [Cyanobacteria bacterium UBA8543]